VQVVFAECSAIYSGRGDSTLARGVRAIFIKEDGSVSIHNENGNKPLNYMKTASQERSRNELGEEVWTFDARHESLAITLHRILGEVEQPLLSKAEDPGIVSSGTEAQLQEWLFRHSEALGEGYRSVQREFNTGAGAVDILALSPEGFPVAVEVKRVAMLGAVDQVRRYVESMKALGESSVVNPETGEVFELDFSKTSGLVAALDLRPKMLELAAKRELPSVVIPAYWRDPEGKPASAEEIPRVHHLEPKDSVDGELEVKL